MVKASLATGAAPGLRTWRWPGARRRGLALLLGRLHQHAVLDARLPADDDLLADRQAIGHQRIVEALLAHLDVLLLGLVVLADDIDEQAVRPVLDGGLRHDDDVLRVRTSSRVETERPGHSALSWLSKLAFIWIVPLAWSTWLLSSTSVPFDSVLLPSEDSASTCTLPPASALLMSGTWSSGAVSTTEIGCMRTIETMPVVSAAWTMLPGSTMRKPARPASGERMVV